MTHRLRIRADRLLAVPAAIVFNALARVMGAVMGRDHSSGQGRINRIIVAKLLGMGSILQAVPLLRALKQTYPDCKITFVTLRSNYEMVRRIPEIDQILTLDDRGVLAILWTTMQTVMRMIRLRADLYFDLEIYSAFASLLALWAVSRNRVGFYRGSARYKNGIYTHLIYFNTRVPVRELYLQLGRVVGAFPVSVDGSGAAWVNDSDRDAARAALMRDPHWRANEPYVVVNPNASELLLERRWPMRHVVEAVEKLTAAGRQIVFVGSPQEAPYVQGVLKLLSPGAMERVVDTAGQVGIGGLLALLEGAACVLTNDTGPMHMAIALGRPTVCLFGPVSPEHYGHEENVNVEIIYAPVLCSPCVHVVDPPPCNGDNVCMQRIEPELAVAAVNRLLEAAANPALQPKAARMTRLPLLSSTARGTPLGVVVRASIDTGVGM